MDGTPVAALDGLAAAGRAHGRDVRGDGGLAVIVYEFVGVSVLRRAWFNMDRSGRP